MIKLLNYEKMNEKIFRGLVYYLSGESFRKNNSINFVFCCLCG
jgi:hypothetical protein